MYRIRFHGRGGQGLKTASRILGTAFFLEGYEVQDAPRYGAERRGAPIFAFVRADKKPINERGVITNPDLIVVADDSLVTIPTAGVLQGLTVDTVLLILSDESADVWQQRLGTEARILVLPPLEASEYVLKASMLGTLCTAAAASLVAVISRESLEEAIRQELSAMDDSVIENNIKIAHGAYDAMLGNQGLVKEKAATPVENYKKPGWIDMPFEDASISAPTIHGALTSVEVKTGLWRTMRPVINHELCNRCWWVCSSYCPEGAINIGEDGYPHIDYEHCKGCMICVAQCPAHAIMAIAEKQAKEKEKEKSGEKT